MKKNLACVLVIVFVLGIVATAFAAPTSFSDVPAKHWAYSAVAKLANAGLIDGYGDGTFCGDKAISRYEMAILVAKALDRYDAADAANKQLIDKLSAEFATELNRLGARVDKVEAKTKVIEAKTNTWIVGGETRIRNSGNDNPTPGGKLKSGDKFDFRQRITFRGNINDNSVFNARIATMGGNRFGNMKYPESGSEISLDLMNVTVKNALGLDSVRVGRSCLDFFSRGLIGKPFNTDGILLNKKIGDVKWQGWTGNIKPVGDGERGTTFGDSSQLTTSQFAYKLNNNLTMGAGYYWADATGDSSLYGNLNAKAPTYGPNAYPGSKYNSSQGWDANFAYKMGELTLLGDYISTSLEKAVNLPDSPKAFAVELTNSKSWPYMYPVVNLVNPSKTGTDAWMVAYRSMDPGSVPAGTGGFDYSSNCYISQFNAGSKASDNVKGYWVVYQNVIAKNTILSLEYQDLKFKNLGITGLSNDKLDKTYQVSFQFYY